MNGNEDAAASWMLAAAAWERTGDGPGQIEALGVSGALLIFVKPDEAKGLFERSLALAKAETKRPLAAAQALHNVGLSLYYRRRLNEARAFWETVLSIGERLAPNTLAVAACLNNLGSVASGQGDLSVAEDYYKRALAINEKLVPNSQGVAASRNGLGNVA